MSNQNMKIVENEDAKEVIKQNTQYRQDSAQVQSLKHEDLRRRRQYHKNEVRTQSLEEEGKDISLDGRSHYNVELVLRKNENIQRREELLEEGSIEHERIEEEDVELDLDEKEIERQNNQPEEDDQNSEQDIRMTDLEEISLGHSDDSVENLEENLKLYDKVAPSVKYCSAITDPLLQYHKVCEAIRFWRGKLEQPVSPVDVYDGEAYCRICYLSDGSFITVCDCRGTLKFVHRSCHSEWLSTSNRCKCEVCGFQY
uniref:RING-CH-type domain-containing protein n=1 Tax=Clastoptera arizonana TaxID=38151 RepID=A0A1B6D267_9HEMI